MPKLFKYLLNAFLGIRSSIDVAKISIILKWINLARVAVEKRYFFLPSAADFFSVRFNEVLAKLIDEPIGKSFLKIFMVFCAKLGRIIYHKYSSFQRVSQRYLIDDPYELLEHH